MLPPNHSARKRRRETDSKSSVTATQAEVLVVDLLSSITSGQRLAALQRIRDFMQGSPFAGSIVKNGSVLISLARAGIIPSLLLQLSYSLERMPDPDFSVASLSSELLGMLVQRRLDEEMGADSNELNNPQSLAILFKALAFNLRAPILGIIHVISSEFSGALRVAQSTKHLCILAQCLKKEEAHESEVLEGLGCLKNISCYAEDHRRELLCAPHLKESLCALAQTSRSQKSLERLSAIFRNLSVAQDCRTIMAADADIRNALLNLSKHSGNNLVQRNLLNTFISISAEHNASAVILMHADGSIIPRIKIWLHDDDVVIRKRTCRFLRSLTNQVSAVPMVNNTELLELLTHVALKDENHGVRIDAAEAFAKFVTLVKPSPSHFRLVLDSILRLIRSPSFPMEKLACVMREYGTHLDFRAVMAECSELLDAVAKVATSSESSERSKENICLALLDLSFEEANLARLARANILDALIQNINDGRSTHHPATIAKQRAAIETLLRLASCPQNRSRMVNHPGLVQELIRRAAQAPEDGSKQAIKHVILSLIGDL